MGAACSSAVAAGEQDTQMIDKDKDKDNPKPVGDFQSEETESSQGHEIPRRLFQTGGRKSSRKLGKGTSQSDAIRSSSKGGSLFNLIHDAVTHNFTETEVLKKGLPGGLVGLQNLGNTCFINSSLQCLSNSIPLTDYFLFYDYKKEINQDASGGGTGGKLATAYAELMKEMWLTKNPRRLVHPSPFLRSLGTFAPQFNDKQQHDTHELLSYLLDGIHEDLKRPCANDQETTVQQVGKNSLPPNNSVIVDIFEGQFRNTCTCKCCGHQNIRLEPSMHLSLPIADNCESLEDCLALFLEEEELVGDNQWYCEKCKKNTDTTKKTDIWVLPPVLIIHLKRFTYCNFGKDGYKNKTVLRYPITNLDLSDIVQKPGAGSLLYDLYAISNHVGDLNRGHYTAYALNRFDDQWYEFNDRSFRTVDPYTEFENSSTPYLLFYNRVASAPSGPDDQLESSIRSESERRPGPWPYSHVSDGDFRNFQRPKRLSDEIPGDMDAVQGEETLIMGDNSNHVVDNIVDSDDWQKPVAKVNEKKHHVVDDKNKSVERVRKSWSMRRQQSFKTANRTNDDSGQKPEPSTPDDTLPKQPQDDLEDIIVDQKEDNGNMFEEEWC